MFAVILAIKQKINIRRNLNLITLVEFWLNKVRIRRLNLRKVTLGDVSVL